MATNEVVRARIDGRIKKDAAIVLETIGLTISDVFRLLLTRIAMDKALPFAPLIPNEKTIQAMIDVDRGAFDSFGNIKKLMADLNDEN